MCPTVARRAGIFLAIKIRISTVLSGRFDTESADEHFLENYSQTGTAQLDAAGIGFFPCGD
jgi:hypothetical protein